MNQQTITINGVIYDVHTGLPVVADATPAVITPARRAPSAPKPSQTVHSATQKSHTLNRRVVKKTPIAPQQIIKKKHVVAPQPDIARTQDIKKFAPHPVGIKKSLDPVHPKTASVATRPAVTAPLHPVVARTVARIDTARKPAAQPAVVTPKPSHVIKKEAIDAAMAQATVAIKDTKPPKKRRQIPRHLSIATASLALILLGGYFTYLNMPNLSVRVAAAQAGIAASYPSYHPDGYSLKGPVAYTDGQVNIKFASNSGPQSYTISQVKTTWDSSAVEQDINQKTSGSYSTSTVSGLTIYLYGNNASWVNGGILYSLTGNAPLSSEQIDHIATSM